MKKVKISFVMEIGSTTDAIQTDANFKDFVTAVTSDITTDTIGAGLNGFQVDEIRDFKVDIL